MGGCWSTCGGPGRRTCCSGASCLGCARPGRLLCPACRESLPRGGHPAGPTPRPAGLAPSYAAAAYDGLVRDLVVGLKEHRLLSLARPAGRAARRRGPGGRGGGPGGDGAGGRWCWCPCPRGRPAPGPAGTSPPARSPSGPPRLLRAGGQRRRRRPAAALATRGRRPGRPRRGGPRGQPGGVDVLPRARPAAPRPALSAGPGRGLRRRAHDRRDRPRGAARAGGRRGSPVAAVAAVAATRRRLPARPGRRRGESSGHRLPCGSADRLASGHGVRPGPWLRRPDAAREQGARTTSRCQSQAKRST